MMLIHVAMPITLLRPQQDSALAHADARV